jgi:ribosome biogenesis GTPase
VTVNHPETSTTFIDRFLASAEAYRVPVVLIFNKTDLLNEEESHYQQMMMTLYQTIGYQCFQVSAKSGEGVEQLRALLKDKVTLLSGNSGVGKSTMINLFLPNADLKTQDISDAHDKGMHTTTFSEMLELPEGGYVIDTPGNQRIRYFRYGTRGDYELFQGNLRVLQAMSFLQLYTYP